MKANHGSTIRRSTALMIFLALTLTACLPGLMPAPTPTLTPQPSTPEARTSTPTWTATVAPDTATMTITPSPTEARLYTPESIGYIPPSMAEAGKCVPVADPIKEPEKFTNDVRAVINAAKPLINAYEGPFLQVGGFGANALILQVTQDMGVVGCGSFVVDGGVNGAEKKTGIGLLIPFMQPDGEKTAIFGVIDPRQINLSEKQARTPDDILAKIAKTGLIKYDPQTGWNEFGFNVDSVRDPKYYSEWARQYMATRGSYSEQFLKCVINRENISEDIAVLLTMVRK